MHFCLNNKTNKLFFQIYILSQFGGSNEKTTARKILRYLFNDEVLKRYTWKATVADKNIFNNFKEINNTILSAVRKTFPAYTEHTHGKFMQEDIKFAKFRIISKE